MNLLLVLPVEVQDGRVTLRERQAHHVSQVLGKKAGDTLRIGVLGVGTSVGIVELVQKSGEVVVRLGDIEPEKPSGISVTLALPRPKALSRVLSILASLAVDAIDLVHTFRVDPAYWSSPRLLPQRIREDLVLGLEQGRHVHLPPVNLHRSLSSYLAAKTRPGDANAGTARVLFDPGGHVPLSEALPPTSAPVPVPVWLVFGPDGGFVQTELDDFTALGFRRTRLGQSILRTEVAIAFALGQLELLRSLRLSSPSAP